MLLKLFHQRVEVSRFAADSIKRFGGAVVGFLYLIMRRSLKGGGPGSVMGFGKSKAREFKEGDIKTTLRDVAGVEEAKVEVAELVEFLCDPKRFVSVGGLIPGGSKWWARQERVRRCSPGQ